MTGDDEPVRYHHHPHRRTAKASRTKSKHGRHLASGPVRKAKASTAKGAGAKPVRAKAHAHAKHVSTTANPMTMTRKK